MTTDHATIEQVREVRPGAYSGQTLAEWCISEGIDPYRVNGIWMPPAYPRAAWIACYGVDLSQIWGDKCQS